MSLGRVSVPVWPITLSGRLRIVALVGFYPTNKLMRRGPICKRQPEPSFSFFSCEKKHHPVLAPVSRGYPDLTGRLPRVTHPSGRRSPNKRPEGRLLASRARLACIRHAASVRPEPRSNSPQRVDLINDR